ncbi:MAG: hypothetical protein JWP35_4275 [Caulobacter sp.]|nr:hypothetical protein [Caulobacter sp.]
MTKFKTFAAAIALTALAGSSAFAADSMKSDGMMKKKPAATMQSCKAMGDKAMHDKACMAMMKKHDAMKSDAMKGDSMKAEGHR